MNNVTHLTIGLDLGDTRSEVCVLGPHQEVLRRGPVDTNPESLEQLFRDFPGATAVFEVGSQSRWVQPLARSCGLHPIAADPRQLKLITQSCKKTDRRDAYLLARAGQGLPDLLNPVEHRSEESHADLALLRTRELLVDQRTRMVNRMRGIVKAAGGRITGCTATYFFSKAKEQIPAHLTTACAPLFAILEALHEQLLKIQRQEKKLVKDKYPAVERLMTVPSIGLQTALTYVLTLESPDRIRGTRNVGAYLGMTPRKKESGNSSPQLGITKAGDTHLRRLLVLCAHHLLARGKDCRLKRWGLELCRRGGSNAKKRAVVAVARKLSVQLLTIWRRNEDYDLWHGMPAHLRPQAN